MLELALIVGPLLLFFILQVTLNKEGLLAFVVLVLLAFTLSQSSNPLGEGLLFLVGLILGLIVEVGLGLILRTQHWSKASFFGVPYWLPLIWGYGFILIHQLGDLILQMS